MVAVAAVVAAPAAVAAVAVAVAAALMTWRLTVPAVTVLQLVATRELMPRATRRQCPLTVLRAVVLLAMAR